jgi:hypothetical protein
LAEDERNSRSDVSGNTRYLNFSKVSHPNWEIFQIKNVQVPFAGAALLEVALRIGYVEDIVIKSIGRFSTNSANGGFLIDWEPPLVTLNLVRQFVEEERDNLYPRQPSIYIMDGIREQVTRHFESYLQFTDTVFRNRPNHYVLDNATRQQLLDAAITQSINYSEVKTVLLYDTIPLASLTAGVGYFQEGDLLLNGPAFAR